MDKEDSGAYIKEQWAQTLNYYKKYMFHLVLECL